MEKCFSDVDITVTEEASTNNSEIGGVVSEIQGGNLRNCTFTGQINHAANTIGVHIGGIAGYIRFSSGSIISCKKARIRKLAKLYPDLSVGLMDIYENMYDLMPIFKSKNYYKKEMEGSYSIKKVLPALFPNDPELDYDGLPGVKKGDEASKAYKEMRNASPENIEEIRAGLLAYCKLDTLAMVKIWMKLNEAVEQNKSLL